LPSPRSLPSENTSRRSTISSPPVPPFFGAGPPETLVQKLSDGELAGSPVGDFDQLPAAEVFAENADRAVGAHRVLEELLQHVGVPFGELGERPADVSLVLALSHQQLT
jgi:hypothetical protein